MTAPDRRTWTELSERRHEVSLLLAGRYDANRVRERQWLERQIAAFWSEEGRLARAGLPRPPTRREQIRALELQQLERLMRQSDGYGPGIAAEFLVGDGWLIRDLGRLGPTSGQASELGWHLIRERIEQGLNGLSVGAAKSHIRRGRPSRERNRLAISVAQSNAKSAALADLFGCDRSTIWRLRRKGQMLIATEKPLTVRESEYWAFRDWTPRIHEGKLVFAPPLKKPATECHSERRAA